jgi:hypothetical protein
MLRSVVAAHDIFQLNVLEVCGVNIAWRK